MSDQATRRHGARDRLHAAALDLFAEHGVSGTSLQMIADRLGVTKAAIYHVYRTKEEIVVGVLRPLLERLAAITDAAEARADRHGQLDVLVTGLVDLVVENRELAAIFGGDPFIKHMFEHDPQSEIGTRRIEALLHGPNPGPEDLVLAAMVGAVVMAAGVVPALAAIDDDTLRLHLRASTLRLLRVEP